MKNIEIRKIDKEKARKWVVFLNSIFDKETEILSSDLYKKARDAKMSYYATIVPRLHKHKHLRVEPFEGRVNVIRRENERIYQGPLEKIIAECRIIASENKAIAQGKPREIKHNKNGQKGGLFKEVDIKNAEAWCAFLNKYLQVNKVFYSYDFKKDARNFTAYKLSYITGMLTKIAKDPRFKKEVIQHRAYELEYTGDIPLDKAVILKYLFECRTETHQSKTADLEKPQQNQIQKKVIQQSTNVTNKTNMDVLTLTSNLIDAVVRQIGFDNEQLVTTLISESIKKVYNDRA